MVENLKFVEFDSVILIWKILEKKHMVLQNIHCFTYDWIIL